ARRGGGVAGKAGGRRGGRRASGVRGEAVPGGEHHGRGVGAGEAGGLRCGGGRKGDGGGVGGGDRRAVRGDQLFVDPGDAGADGRDARHGVGHDQGVPQHRPGRHGQTGAAGGQVFGGVGHDGGRAGGGYSGDVCVFLFQESLCAAGVTAGAHLRRSAPWVDACDEEPLKGRNHNV